MFPGQQLGIVSGHMSSAVAPSNPIIDMAHFQYSSSFLKLGFCQIFCIDLNVHVRGDLQTDTWWEGSQSMVRIA